MLNSFISQRFSGIRKISEFEKGTGYFSDVTYFVYVFSIFIFLPYFTLFSQLVKLEGLENEVRIFYRISRVNFQKNTQFLIMMENQD